MNIGKILAGVALFSTVFGTGVKKAVAQEVPLFVEKGTLVCKKLKQSPVDTLKISGQEYFYNPVAKSIKKKISSDIEKGLIDIKNLKDSPKMEKMVDDMGVCKNFGKNHSLCIQYKEPIVFPQKSNFNEGTEKDMQLFVELKKTF